MREAGGIHALHRKTAVASTVEGDLSLHPGKAASQLAKSSLIIWSDEKRGGGASRGRYTVRSVTAVVC